jgi:uncharacterized protein YjiS (DUF1127 family)
MLIRFINDVVSLLDRRHRESKIRHELEILSDEELSHLGLRRKDIKRIARSAIQQQ